MEDKQLKCIAKYAMSMARKMSENADKDAVIRELKDSNITIESIILDHFSCATKEQYNLVYSELRNARLEYLKTGEIKIES